MLDHEIFWIWYKESRRKKYQYSSLKVDRVLVESSGRPLCTFFYFFRKLLLSRLSEVHGLAWTVAVCRTLRRNSLQKPDTAYNIGKR